VGTYPETNVQISYSANGTDWIPIASVEAGENNVQQSYPWTPDGSYIGTNRYLKIATQFGDADIDVSATKTGFKLIGAINITYPDLANIVWDINSDQDIKWTASGLVTPVKIEYSTNAGSSWIQLTDTYVGVDGNNIYPWKVPDSINSEECLFRVSDARPDFASVTDTSAYMFAIRPAITVSEPVEGQNVPASGTVPLRWSVTGTSITQVDLQYSVDNGVSWTTFAPGVAVGQGATYNWTNSFTGKVKNQAKVRVLCTGHGQGIRGFKDVQYCRES